MEQVDYFLIESAENLFGLKPRILELGARIQENQSGLAIRKIFGAKNNKSNYTGVDYIDGEGVDLTSNVSKLPFADNSFSTIVAMNLFEHVEKFWQSFDEVKRLVKKDGVIICSTPFIFEIHGCPYDYFRFTPDFYRNVFKDFKFVVIGWVGDEKMPKNVFAIASNDLIVKNNFNAFYSMMQSKYNSDISSFRKLKNRLRSYVCGAFFRNSIRNFYSLTFELYEN